MFEHSVMKKTSNRIADTKKYPFAGEHPAVVQQLRQLAKTFVQLQDKRHIADYDKSAIDAFGLWQAIHHEKIAQDYLVSLLIKPRD